MQLTNPITTLTYLAIEGFELVKEINANLTQGKTTYDTFDDIFFDTIKSEFQSMESAVFLSNSEKFKDSFIILRSAFELFLYYWLMVNGIKYRHHHIFTINPTNSNSVREARDKTLEKWKKEWKSGNPNYDNAVDIQPHGNDEISIMYEFEGLYEDQDVNKTGVIRPIYGFIITEQYHHTLRFVSELPTIIIGDMFPEITKQNVRQQKMIYNNFIYIDSIIGNLLLNGLITKTQADYIKVHYNFLSAYVHPTKETIRDFTQDVPEHRTLKIDKRIITEQILLYVCRIQYLILKIIVDKFEKENPRGNLEPYKNLIKRLNSNTSYFWFIDNEPTPHDIAISKLRKTSAELGQQKQIADDVILYYEDPLKRLQDIRVMRY